jgi:hypothetical protein
LRSGLRLRRGHAYLRSESESLTVQPQKELR